VVSRLMRESLVDKTVIAGTEAPVRAILPKLNVIQIGGLSIMDRGHAAVLPLLDEIVANQDQHAQVVGVGPGCAHGISSRSASTSVYRPERWRRWRPSRRRRTPTWWPACSPTAASSISRRHSSCSCSRPCWQPRAVRCLTPSRPTICGSIRRRSARSRRTAATPGPTSVGEVFGARSVILLKDVDGLYTADPKTNSDAEFIAEIGAAELIARKLPTLPIEPVVLELLVRAKLAKSIRIVNVLVPGNLTRALNGEPIGTLIHS